MEILFRKLGYAIAPQREAELLAKFWIKRDFNPIIKFVKNNGNFFQDVPFSLPETYKELDKNFPNSKFILTVRESEEVWYQSVVKFQTKLFGKNGNIPTADDLKNATYVHKGYIWNNIINIYKGITEEDPYNEQILKAVYSKHNADIIKHFEGRENQLLVINLQEENTSQKIADFFNLNVDLIDIPWENKTKNI